MVQGIEDIYEDTQIHKTYTRDYSLIMWKGALSGKLNIEFPDGTTYRNRLFVVIRCSRWEIISINDDTRD